MTDEIDNEYAFPQMQKVGEVAQSTGGVTMRDFFAGMAMCGLLSVSNIADNSTEDDVARLSFEQADAMLKARKK